MSAPARPRSSDVMLGSVRGTIDAWVLARSTADAGVEGSHLIALVGGIERLVPGQETRDAIESLRGFVDEALAPALDQLDAPGWLERARQLVALVEAEDDARGELDFGDAARALFRKLDDSELVLRQATRTRGSAPDELRASLAECSGFFFEHVEAFLDAGGLARAFRADFDPGLFARDEQLWRTTLKHELLLGQLELDLDVEGTIEPLRKSRVVSSLRAPRGDLVPFPVLEEPLDAAASPHAPGASSVRTFRWRFPSYEAILDVAHRPARGRAHVHVIRFQREDGNPAAELQGATIRLVGLELIAEAHRASVPHEVLAPAWESWARRPELRARRLDGSEDVGVLVEPA